MNEVVIKYKNQKTLRALTALSEYLGFTIAEPEAKAKNSVYHINGVPVQSGNPKADIQDLATIFTEQDFDAKILRESAWQRKK